MIPGTTPAISYAWDSSSGGTGTSGYDRLSGMTYPTRPETGARSLTYAYGAGGSVDSALNRIAQILEGQLAHATYAYMGTSRRVTTTLGNGIVQSFVDATNVCTGLDRFGPLRDLDFKKNDSTVHRYQYAYDISGNRQSARVQQATIGATAHDNDRSYLYGYDDLQRLISAHMGRLNSGGTGILTNDPAVALRRKMNWSMDALGNWNASELAYSPPTGFSRYDYLDGHTSPDVTTNVNHTVDAFNRITGVTTDDVPVAHVNDSAGNIVFDGTYVYQYDAWNRLTEVNEADSLTSADFAPDGKVNPTAGHEIGSLVIRFAYDGLGRLMMAQRPVSGSPPQPVYRTEHYYYDGVRRIQEVIQTPGTTGGDQFETAHEYVYGPDYVDEFVVESQKTTSGQQDFYILQDANYNVMALTDGTGGVLEQYQWEPYGALATKDTAADPAPHSHIGHQGLFFYRFDEASGPVLATNAVGLYHNRNRWYSPSLGRFTSRDPNETAQLILTTLAMNGDEVSVVAEIFNASGHFSDGMNIFSYAVGNPVLGRDPLGLEDPFAAVDEWQEERVGNALYTLGAINEGTQLGLTIALDVAGSLLGLDVFQSVAVLAWGRGGFWDAMNIVMSVNPLARLGKAASRIGRAFKWMNRAGDTGRVAGKAAEHLFKILPYKQAAKLTRGFKSEIQAHHILEVRHAQRWGLNTDHIPAVILPKGVHDEITAALRQRLPYLGDAHPWTMTQVRAAYQEVYTRFGFGDWLGHIERYFQ